MIVIISHIFVGCVCMHITYSGFDKAKTNSMPKSYKFADTYNNIIVGHLQTQFCLLMLVYVLVVAYLVTEIMWHRYSLK